MRRFWSQAGPLLHNVFPAQKCTDPAREPTKPGTIEPLSGQEASERWPYTYRLEPSPKLAAYHERLFIVWGHPRPWLQKADEHDKAVSELLAPLA
jgi:hypothetical protein